MKKYICVILAMVSFGVRAGAQSLSEVREKNLSRRGVVVAQTIKLALEPGTPLRIRPVSFPGSLNLRLHFVLDAASTTNGWSLRVIDSDGNTAWRFTPGEQPENSIWSDEIPGSRATVELRRDEGSDSSQPVRLTIDQVVKGTVPAHQESISGSNQLRSINNQPPAIKTLGRAVARLRFVGDDGLAYVCTGFLISRDLFLTNNHCINTDAERLSALADFDFNEQGPTQGVRFRELIMTDRGLDFSLLRLSAPQPPSRDFLRLDRSVPPVNRNMLVIEHPGGEPKQVSIVDCRVHRSSMVGLTIEPTDFSHFCDTVGGSSGSPMIDSTLGKVVGLHHLGFDIQRNIRVNRAVQMNLILDAIGQRKPSVLAETAVQ